MGKIDFVLTVLCLACATHCAALQPLSSAEKHQLEREARLVVDLMQNYHESGRLFRDLDNHEILTNYLTELDPGSDFLLKDDVEFVQMRFGRTLRSVYLLKGDLQPAFEIFELLSQRVKERTAWIGHRLDSPVDLDSDGNYTAEHKPAASAITADQRWELKLKDEVLSEIVRGRTESEARAAVAKNYAKLQRRVASMDSLAVRERFFDGLLQAFDPHSGYFSADSTREFNLEMMGSVTGAGLEIKKENGLCVVSSIEAGGPADLATDLRPGDIIEAYGEADAPLVSVKGKRLREIVGTIRGKAGTILKLSFRHSSTEPLRELQITRAPVVAIDDRARGAIAQVPALGGHFRRIGWINLPKFSTGKDETDSSSATKDVAELLAQMNKTGVDGVVLDLRENGGGALTEALALSGLFIPKGPVMLSRGLDSKIIEHLATEANERYDGPLVILISDHSASASEIFAGAMKFHHRALIVGNASTFGKGTAQNYIELAKTNQAKPEDAASWGTLRLTFERFYQPDGQSVQRNGITADIVLPQIKAPDAKREESLPHALPAESVTAPTSANHAVGIKNFTTPDLCSQLRQRTEDNLRTLPEWSLYLREQQFFETLMSEKQRPLRLQDREARQQETEIKIASLRTERRKLANEVGFPTETIEIESVRNALDAHRSHLATLTTANGEPALFRLEQGAFIVKTEKNQFRRLWLNQMEYLRFLGDSEPLAAAFSSSTGRAFAPERMHQTLQALALLEEPDESKILSCFAAGSNSEPGNLRKGVEAVLLRMIEIDAEFRRHRPALDVQLRESLRIASGWADAIATSSNDKHP